MDSLPATVPAVTASPGDPELLGPLSVLYAALIAKLLEVTVPSPREGLRLWKWGGPGPGRASVQSDMTVPGEASGVRGMRRCGVGHFGHLQGFQSFATVSGKVLTGGILSLGQCQGVGPIL